MPRTLSIIRPHVGAQGRLLILASAGCLAGIALYHSAAADAVDTGQLILQAKFKTGDTLKYQTDMKLGFSLPTPAGSKGPSRNGSNNLSDAGASSFAVNAVQDIRVRRGAAEGGGDLDVTTSGQNSLPGQPPIISNDTRPVIMTYDASGKLTGIRKQTETASGNPMFSGMLGQGLLCMQGVVLPSKPVKIGETWTQHMAIPGVTGGSESIIKTTLTKVEYVRKYRTAHLHVVITTPVKAYLDAALQPVAKASNAASSMTGLATVTDEINFAIAEGRVIRSIAKGRTNMSVSVGKPSGPEAATPKRRKPGSATTAAPAPPAKPSQVLNMTVTTDIETNFVEPTKKLPGSA